MLRIFIYGIRQISQVGISMVPLKTEGRNLNGVSTVLHKMGEETWMK